MVTVVYQRRPDCSRTGGLNSGCGVDLYYDDNDVDDDDTCGDDDNGDLRF